MSLVVSLRIPDGVVIAADSLSTIQGQIAVQPQLRTRCPKCKADIDLKNLPPMHLPPIALSTSSFAQKLFPFLERFGVGAYGLSILLDKTVGYHIQALEQHIEAGGVTSVTGAAQMLLDEFDALVHQQVKDIKKAPDNFYPVGFQVVGYDDDDEGKTVEVKAGKHSKLVTQTSLGCTVSGSAQVVQKLWELGPSDPSQQPQFPSFSLQDAIDYADFLIETTASYQRFAPMIPNVGGQVDIALVTPFHKFTWIRQKHLARVILGEKEDRYE